MGNYIQIEKGKSYARYRDNGWEHWKCLEIVRQSEHSTSLAVIIDKDGYCKLISHVQPRRCGGYSDGWVESYDFEMDVKSKQAKAIHVTLTTRCGCSKTFFVGHYNHPHDYIDNHRVYNAGLKTEPNMNWNEHKPTLGQSSLASIRSFDYIDYTIVDGMCFLNYIEMG